MAKEVKEVVDEESLKRISEFLAKHDQSVDTISKQKMKQLVKIDSAIQSRLSSIREAQGAIKSNSITVTAISEDSGISRKTFYNNDLLRLFVEEYSTPDDEKTALSGELERLKAKHAESERRIREFVRRDIETENLHQENMRLQAEIVNLETRNRSLETQYEKLQKELEELKKRTPAKPNVVQFPNNS